MLLQTRKFGFFFWFDQMVSFYFRFISDTGQSRFPVHEGIDFIYSIKEASIEFKLGGTN